MKKLLIASATVAAISLGSLALAQPAGHDMRHHEPVKEMIKHLRGLNLSDAQHEQIKSYLGAFKNANPRLERSEMEMPDFDFATATETQISSFLQTQLEERESKLFALAQLRHDIFNVLDEKQQATILARIVKREAKSDKRRHASDGKKSQYAKHLKRENKAKKFRGHEPRDSGHSRDSMLFEDIELSDTQKDSLAALRSSFKETAKSNRETLRSFKDAQRALIQSPSFSQDTWNALVSEYKDDLVNAGVAKAKHRQAMFAVLTSEQQSQLKTRRQEQRKLMDLINP